MAGITLWIDGARWAEHLQTVAGATPGLVPVIKGNGYGYGLTRLAEESAKLGADTVAVGVPAEVEPVRRAFSGDVVILNPWGPAGGLPDDDGVIITVSRLADLRRLAESGRPRALIEIRTSMRRHGIDPTDLRTVASLLDGVDFQGWTIHLPLFAEGRYAEADRLARAGLAAASGPIWFSHLPAEDVTSLSRQLATANDGVPAPVRLRVGTRLWLGDEDLRRTTATVLDVHPIRRGDRVGYRQRRCPADGWVVVVAGGTSNGIGLEAPTAASTLRQRAVAVASGSLEAAGLALSPYTIAGRKRWFLEPPHMQSSLVYLPANTRPPAIGEDVPVELRLTTATVDQVVVS